MRKTLKERIFAKEVEVVVAADLRCEVERLLESHGIRYDLGWPYYLGVSKFYICKIWAWTYGDIRPIETFVREKIHDLEKTKLLKNVEE